MLFGSLWNPSIFDGINQKKDKKEDIYVLLFDESLHVIQQLKNLYNVCITYERKVAFYHA
jgi:hypothetical protein